MGAELRMTEAEIVAFLQRRLFAQDPGALVAVWLYGSAARGELRADSDVDLALLATCPLDAYEVFLAAQELAAQLHRDVDLVDLSRVGTVLRSQVVVHGRRIHTASEPKAARFEMYTLSDYARLNEERKQVVDAFMERYRGG
jgi:uncharacterized protein